MREKGGASGNAMWVGLSITWLPWSWRLCVVYA